MLPGKGFGEVALTKQNSKRTASTLAGEDCHLAVLNKAQFDQFGKDFKIYKTEKIISYLKSFKFIHEI